MCTVRISVSAPAPTSMQGVAPIREHEDVDLVARCRSLGAAAASDEAEVVTSGRFTGRTPGGYAGYLQRQALDLAGSALRAVVAVSRCVRDDGL